MTWEEFKELDIPISSTQSEETDIECPECGTFLYRNTKFVFTSLPAQYHYECPNCGWSGSWFNLTN